MKVGDTLRNGTTLIASKESNRGFQIVLAMNPTGLHPFITWVMDEQGNCSSGDYFMDIADAVESFKERR